MHSDSSRNVNIKLRGGRIHLVICAFLLHKSLRAQDLMSDTSIFQVGNNEGEVIVQIRSEGARKEMRLLHRASASQANFMGTRTPLRDTAARKYF